jgi:hypothetical protein
MNNAKFSTQIQLMANHLKNIGAINTDEARRLYTIVDVPKVISKLSKTMEILHNPINRPNPVTGKIRGIMEYRLDKNNAE